MLHIVGPSRQLENKVDGIEEFHILVCANKQQKPTAILTNKEITLIKTSALNLSLHLIA